jgi:thermolysin
MGKTGRRAIAAALIASTLIGTAGVSFAATDKQVLRDESGEVHNVVGKLGRVAGATAEARGLAALDKVKAEFGFVKATGEFKLLKSHKDEIGTEHTKFQRAIRGIPVVGAELIAHVKNGDVAGVTGHYSNEPANATTASIDGAAAIQAAIRDLDAGTVLEAPTASLVYYPRNGTALLAYEVSYRYLAEEPGDWIVYVDAIEGTVIEATNRLAGVKAVGSGTGVAGDAKTLNVDRASGVYRLQDFTKPLAANQAVQTAGAGNAYAAGTLLTDSDNQWTASSQRAAVDAHATTGKVYDYFFYQLGRNSHDGLGGSMVSVVSYGQGFNQAFRLGNATYYGDGDGTTFLPLSGSPEIVGHEWAHAFLDAVTDLRYGDQPGAVAESWADALGLVASGQTNWLIGDEVFTPGVRGDAIRSLQNPQAYGQPAHRSQYVLTSEDNGGIHTNAGIPNKAFYNFANAIGSRTIAAKVWYVAARDYMVSETGFSAARSATLQATGALYGTSSSYYTALLTAWSDVGVN